MSAPLPQPPDVNRFLPASVAPECRVCRVLDTCKGVFEDCPFRQPDAEEPDEA